MASFEDLKFDWSMLCQECTDCWTQSDLQLAAELGKTLLERNKELENSVKQHQTTIEEQAQEIEYMKKQTAALREVNDSRLRIYEQLEVSIQDLERANHRLSLENTADKKQIKSQCFTVETLESRCDELQKKIDELNVQHEALLRRQHASNTVCTTQTRSTTTWNAAVTSDGSIKQVAAPSPAPVPETAADTSIRELASTLANDEEITDLLRQLHEARSQRAREQRRVTELGEQLTSLLQENANLEEQLNAWRHKAQDMKNLQDEISALEEVRQGHLCGRCLRGVDNRTHDELSVMLDQEEDDDLSMIESIVNDSHRESETPLVQDTSNKTGAEEEVDDNPYRVLVQKYEALLEVQRHPAPRRKTSVPTTCLSLQEELEMSGDFSSFNNTHLEHDNHHENDKAIVSSNETQKNRSSCRKPFSATPTDFSEAETSSSGFSDETSNKATQTDGRPGSFLCSIADGEDCKFSIYDDASPIESRFRKTPEYRQLFREIFCVLKRAAEAKDEGEKLPLLDDSTATHEPRVPPVTPAQEDAPSEMTDDNQSVMSSVISSVVSEPPYRSQSPMTNEKRAAQSSSTVTKNRVGSTGTNAGEKGNDVVLRPLHTPRRQPLEYLSMHVNVRKKSSAKKNSVKKTNERPTTPDIVPTTNPKMTHGKTNSNGRRRFRPLTSLEQKDSNGAIWNGNTLNFFPSKSKETPISVRKQNNTYTTYVSEQHNTTYEYRPSAASEEVARLRRLEMSYAEALRLPNKPKTNNRRN